MSLWDQFQRAILGIFDQSQRAIGTANYNMKNVCFLCSVSYTETSCSGNEKEKSKFPTCNLTELRVQKDFIF